MRSIRRSVLEALPDAIRYWLMRRDVGRAPAIGWHIRHAGLLYVQVPKVATRSIRAAMGHWAFPDLAVGWDAARRGEEAFGVMLTPPTIARLRGSTYGFAFVRDPLSRLLSCYRDKVALTPDGKPPRLASKVYPAFGIRAGMPFDEFVSVVSRTPDRTAERHFRSQHTFLYDGDTPIVDFVGRAEALTGDWSKLQDRFGFPDLPRLNRTTPTRGDVAYTYESALAAAERYERDVELFGYTEAVSRRLAELRG